MAADLDDVVLELKSIVDELNFTKEHSAAKIILDPLRQIELRLIDIEYTIAKK